MQLERPAINFVAGNKFNKGMAFILLFVPDYLEPNPGWSG